MKVVSLLLGLFIGIAWYLVQTDQISSDDTTTTTTTTSSTTTTAKSSSTSSVVRDRSEDQEQAKGASTTKRRHKKANKDFARRVIKDSIPGWHHVTKETNTTTTTTNNNNKTKTKRRKIMSAVDNSTITSSSNNNNSSSNVNSTLGYTVQEIHVGVLASKESKEYAQKLALDVRKMFPDRFRVIVLDPTLPVDEWPKKLHIMVLATTKPNFPYEQAQNYVEKMQHSSVSSSTTTTTLFLPPSLLVLTDLDLYRNLSDRRILYNVLSAGGLGSYLPRYSYASRDGFVGITTQEQNQEELELIDRQDQIEVNGKILLKPVLERPVDPSDSEVRIYYPRSDGGGCKIIKFSSSDQEPNIANFEAGIEHIRKGGGGEGNDDDKSSTTTISYIYEELSDEPLVKIRKRENRITNFVKQGLEKKSLTPTTSFGDDDQVSDESDLSRMDRKIVIVTTASMPWMTGTAVNPLLRAAYLKRGRPTGSVTLVIPWLDKADDQAAVYGTHRYASQEEQEVHVRSWLRDQAGMPDEADPETGIKILWYPSRYVSALGSIFPVGNICKLIPDEDADVCILEEPEHLNWIRGGQGEGEIWTEKFKHVVGVIHTNYRAYASKTSAGLIAAPFVTGMSTLMVRAYCDKVIKLSATLQTYSPEKEVVSNVHGVRSDFLEEGKRRSEQTRIGISPEVEETGTPKAYFIGKLLWDKGLDHLLRLEYFYKAVTGQFFPIDIVGDGPDRKDIEAAFEAENKRGKVARTIQNLLSIDDDDTKLSSSIDFSQLDKKLESKKDSLFEVPASMILNTGRVPGTFHGRQDHAHFCTNYRVLVNPSTTEVLCTTVAEALAMGKFVVIPKHPSNEFFYQFPNCLVYDNKVEFVKHMVYALSNEPEPLTEDQAYIFTWEAATERLIKASAITMKEGRARAKARNDRTNERIAKTYDKVGASGELLRMIMDGEGPLKKFNKSDSEGSSGDGAS